MRSELFDKNYQENQTTDRFVLQSKKMLRAHFDGDDRIIASAGSMVAYQGNVRFGYKGSGGLKNFIKKSMSGENAPLMTIDGAGDVFLAKEAKEIFTILLEGESITISSHSLLAFEDSLKYEIKMSKNIGSMMAGGLFNIELSGHGYVAIVSDGQPLLLDCSQQRTYVDPQAALCWSSNLSANFKNDTNIGTLFGRGSGETVQMELFGQGFVIVQPSENGGNIGGGSQGSSGSAGNIIDLFS